MPVSSDVSTTVAPGTTDRLASRTVPSTEADSNWAALGATAASRSTTASVMERNGTRRITVQTSGPSRWHQVVMPAADARL